jgi:phosphoribosyl 1,2-cyclic phosphodiesterase
LVLDVGQGDATLVVGPTGRGFLIDTGPEGLGEEKILPTLNKEGIERLDWLLLTHYDIDHIGSAADLLQQIDPPLALLDRGPSTAQDHSLYFDYLEQATGRRRQVAPGEVFELGGEETDYEEVFPDIDPSDPYGGYFQAVYDNEIMTGDGDTHNFRPEEGINRAEISKVMNKALEVHEYNTVNEDMEDLDLEYTEEEPSEEIKDSSDEEEFMEYDTSKEQASFLSWLMAFLPFFN